MLKPNSLARHSLGFLAGLGILCLAYGSMVFPDYLVLDDAISLSDVLQGTHGSALWALQLGRPVNAFYIHYGFRLFHTIGQLWGIRMVTVLTLAACFTALAALLRRFFDGWAAYCVALMTFLLPPFVVSVMFAQIACYPVGFLLALFAALLIDGHLQSASLAFRPGLLLGAAGLMVLALFTDQPAAQAVFCLPVLYALGLPEQDTLAGSVRCFVTTLCVFGLAGVVYFSVWQAYVHVFFPAAALGQRVVINSISQAIGKVTWFSGVLIEAGRLFVFRDSAAVPAAVYAVILLHFGFLKQSASGRLVRAGLWVALLPASYAANLLVAENWSEFRTQFALQACLWISLAAAAWRLWARLIPPSLAGASYARNGLAILAVLSLVLRQAVWIGPNFVAPHAREVEAMESAMRDFERDRGTATRLLLLRANWNANAPAFTRYDLIGVPASVASWVAIPMARLAYWEDFHRPLPIAVADQGFGEPLPKDLRASDFVIDVDALLRAWTASAKPRPQS